MYLIEPGQAQAGSGHCFICEQGIDRFTQTFVIDTLFDVELPGHYLDGRKYICQGCAFDLARVCGFAKASEVNDVKTLLSTFKMAQDEALSGVRQEIVRIAENLNNIPPVPDISFIPPQALVSDAEAKEEAKPKRGRPSKESTFQEF